MPGVLRAAALCALASSARGQSEVNITCVLGACAAEFQASFNDETCMNQTNCLTNVCGPMYATDTTPGKYHYQNCTTKCIVTYDKPVCDAFTACAMGKGCMTLPPINVTCPLAEVDAGLSLADLGGEWWQHYGKNPLWDCYPCQHIHNNSIVDDQGFCGRTVAPSGPVQAPCWNYTYSYDVFVNSGATSYYGQVWQLPDIAKGKPVEIYYEYQGSVHNETWYLLKAVPERYVLMQFCSYMLSWTNVGSIVWVRPGVDLTTTEMSDIAAVYQQKLGWDFPADFCAVRHGDSCQNTPITPAPPVATPAPVPATPAPPAPATPVPPATTPAPDSTPNITCIIRHCMDQLNACMADKDCSDAFDAMNACEQLPASARCPCVYVAQMQAATKGVTAFLDFIYCAMGADCIGDCPEDGTCLAADADAVQNLTSLDQIEGDWWVVRGVNCGQGGANETVDPTPGKPFPGAYDWLPCQHERILRSSGRDFPHATSPWVNNITFCGGRNGGLAQCTTGMIDTVANISLTAPGVVLHNYTDAPVNPQVEYWRVVSYPHPDYMLMLWCGSIRSTFLRYNGGIALSRNGRTDADIPPSVAASFAAAAAKHGVDWNQMCPSSNTECP